MLLQGVENTPLLDGDVVKIPPFHVDVLENKLGLATYSNPNPNPNW